MDRSTEKPHPQIKSWRTKKNQTKNKPSRSRMQVGIIACFFFFVVPFLTHCSKQYQTAVRMSIILTRFFFDNKKMQAFLIPTTILCTSDHCRVLNKKPRESELFSK